MSKTSLVNIVTALTCEARPLIDALKLKRLHKISAFSIYSNDEFFLIISGVGKVNAAASTAFLHAIAEQPTHAFYLNLGIAGSDNHQLGELIAPHKIVDRQSQQVWYPNVNLHKFKTTANLMTVDQPAIDYQPNTLIDMEASGFFPTAAKLVGHDQVHLLKVISDNHENPIANINAHKVTQLIENKLDVIMEFIQRSKELSLNETRLLPDDELFNAITQQWHFTNYQQHQLSNLMRRWKINFPNEALFEKLKIFKNSEQILNFFQK